MRSWQRLVLGVEVVVRQVAVPSRGRRGWRDPLPSPLGTAPRQARGPARGPPETGKRLLVMSSPSRFLELKVGDKNSDLGHREAKPVGFIST